MTRMLPAALLLLCAVCAVAAPQGPAKARGKASPCIVRGSPVQLDVHCPSATLEEFLLAARNATGLRGEYPPEVASARVSLTMKRATLAKALENALTGFNFAVWPDQQTRAGVYVSILGARPAAELPDTPGSGDLSGAPNPAARSIPPDFPAEERPLRTARRTGENQQHQTFGGQIGGRVAASSGAGGGMPGPRAELLQARSEAVLAPASPNATLLTPPTSGNTPIQPQQVDGVVLRPTP